MSTQTTPQTGETVIPKTKRDRSLDFLKGFACIQMLIAHSPVIFFDTPGSIWIRALCGYATTIFFGISGITALIQIKHYGIKATLGIYVWLYFLGVSMVFLVFHTDNLDHIFIVEMLQIIALGCIMLILLESYVAPNRWGYLAISLVFIALKFLIDAWGANQLQPWPLPRALVTPVPGLLHYDLFLNPNFYPGFTLIPWLWVFPFCIFVRRSSPRFNILWGVICLLAVGVMYLMGFDLALYNKWDIPPEYFLALTGYTMIQFGVIHPDADSLIARLPIWIEKLGKDVLLFLYIHFAGIFFGGFISVALFQGGLLQLPGQPQGFVFTLFPTLTILTRQYLAWCISLLIALGVLYLVKKIPLAGIFDRIASWYFLVFLIWFVPMVTPEPGMVWFLELFFGITYVVHFSKLTTLLRRSGLEKLKAA